MPRATWAVALVSALMLTACTSTPDQARSPENPGPAPAAALPDAAGSTAYSGPRLVGRTTGDFDVTVVSDDLIYRRRVPTAG